MLKVTNLSAELNNVRLRGISFEVGKGQILGIIGPSGAGKSALLKAIATPGLAEAGQVKINHFDLETEGAKAQQLLGYLPNPPLVDQHLTGVEYLELIASLYDLSPKRRLERILELAEILDCRESLYSLSERLSLAEQQKIAIIAALLHEPTVVVLDEPWLHLDWNGQKALTRLLEALAKKGRSLVVASNDLAKIEITSDEILILDDGQRLAQGTLEELTKQSRAKTKSLFAVWESLNSSLSLSN